MRERLKSSLKEGSFNAIAIMLISKGFDYLSQNDQVVGLVLITLGWLMLIIEKYLG